MSLTAEQQSVLLELRAGLPPHFDLTNPATRTTTERLSETLFEQHPSAEQLNTVHDFVVSRKADFPPIYHLAVKNALSRARLTNLTAPVHISMLVAMYKEHNRMQRHVDHENGEDFINEKAAQLNWLTDGSKVTWDLLFVDDGCPEDSGGKARAIIERDNIQHCRAIYLAEAIEAGGPGVRNLNSPADSVKGGSIIAGMWAVTQGDLKPELPAETVHLVAYTDADLSTDLRMCGLLVHEIVAGHKTGAIGSRYLEGSLMDSTDADGMAGPRVQNFVKFRNLLRGMLLYPLDEIRDTNCAFKMFTARTAAEIIGQVGEKTFAFDIEILLSRVLAEPGSIGIVPIVWADSLEEATRRDSQTHLRGLQGMSRIYLAYSDRLGERAGAPVSELRDLAEFVCAMDFEQYQNLCDKLGPDFWEDVRVRLGNQLSAAELRQLTAA